MMNIDNVENDEPAQALELLLIAHKAGMLYEVYATAQKYMHDEPGLNLLQALYMASDDWDM